MKSYAYVAYTPDGRRRRGVVVAESETQASALIGEKGLLPSEILPQGAPPAGGGSAAARLPSRGLRRGPRIDRDTLAVFTRQTAVLLGAGLSAAEALEAVQASDSGAGVEAMAAGARVALMDGQPLSVALAMSAGDLPAWFIAALRAGERSGELDAVFETLAGYLESAATDRAQVASALIYPAFVASVSVLVCFVLMVNVLPEIVEMFESSGRPLPPLTAAMIALSDAAARNWPALLAGAAGVLAVWLAFARVPDLRARRDRLFLRLPLVGRFMRMGAAAQYLRTLALVIASRQPLTEAVHHAAGVLDIAVFVRESEAAGEALRRGEKLSTALSRLGFLPPVARQLIQVGEASARLIPMSERAAVMAETTLRMERKRTTALLDPLLMILVGGVVLVIVLAVLLPIFDLQAVVSEG